jgi:hypothetical protein
MYQEEGNGILHPTIDLSKIKTNSKTLKFFLTVLSAFKFPAPTLEVNPGGKAKFLFSVLLNKINLMKQLLFVSLLSLTIINGCKKMMMILPLIPQL